ncbi:MAG: SufD family Fe-S cluster assembly protein [Carbonactinosporaceae bacterium]
MSTTAHPELAGLGRYEYGWADSDVAGTSARRGLDEDVVRDISAKKNEPEWMLKRRLKGLRLFGKKPMPTWGANLGGIDFDTIKYFVRSTEKQATTWDELPADIKSTYDKLGIPEAEKQRLIAGVAAQYESEVVYHKIREDLEEQGVLFLDTDTGLREHPELFEEYFGSVIPTGDNKFAALNTAVWSGGSFIYVPKGVHVEIPLQAYFRINTENMGQFERTLIIADEDSYVHYVEGCLPAGELVATSDGDWRPIETVRVGEYVLTHDGRPARVSAVQMRDYRGPLYTFTPISPSNAFSVTEEHPLRVVPRREVLVARAPRNGWQPEVDSAKLRAAEPRWVEAKDVHAGDFLVYPKPKPEPASTILPIELARLAGFYLAEGHATLTNGCESLVFSFHLDETEYVEEVQRLCKELYDTPGSVRYDEDKHEARVLVYTRAGYHAMRTHVGTGAAAKQLSPDVVHQDAEFLHALVDAYVRGVGNVVQRNGGTWTRAHTVSRVWAMQLQAILARLGTFATVELRRPAGPGEILGRTVTRRDLFQVQWTEGGNGTRQVRDAGDYFLVPVRRRDVRTADEPVYNLDVAAPDSYLARGFAVHNCTAPIYKTDSLHSAVVEIIVKRGARCRYTTIQNWSNNVYNLVTKRAVAHEGATMEWVDGNLGCLAQGSTVTTAGGTKPIELVSPGEKVLAFDHASGQLCFRQVLGKRFSGMQPVREVSTGTRRLRVTDNHPFYSYTYDPERARKSGRYALAYVRADQLSEAIVPTTSMDYGEPHKLAVPETATTSTSRHQYASSFEAVRDREARLVAPETTTDDLMWLFGAYLGDGSIERATGVNGGTRWAKVVFSVPAEDRARERLLRVMGELMPTTTPGERRDGVTVQWNSVELADLIQGNGFATGAAAKRVPDWVMSLPESQRLNFVAGLLDTDGCASRGRRGFSNKSVNRVLLDDVGRVLNTLGVPGSVHTEFDEPREVVVAGRPALARGAHRLDIAADERLRAVVSPELRAAADAQVPARLRHFRSVGRSSIELPESVEVRKVDVTEPLETVPTWDIEVEGVGNFVSEGFIVHNSKVTMKYPAVWLLGEHAKGETLSVAFAGEGQHQDAGAKMVHCAPNTSSTIISKSVARGGGRTSYRGLVQVQEGAHRSRSTVKCDALLVDTVSRSDTYPYVDVREDDVTMGHEASVSKVSEDQLFYLMSRGMSEDEAMAMIVRGFVEPIAKELPMEYALELNRLIELQMEGAVG